MPEATFWFSSPFREWIGQRTVTVRWEDRITLRDVLERLGAEHAAFRANVTDGGLTQDSFNHLAAVIVDGDFLALHSTVPAGAEVHVFTPLAGGAGRPTKDPTRALRATLAWPSPLVNVKVSYMAATHRPPFSRAN